MKISLGVSVALGGDELFKLFVESASRLASGRHMVSIEFTCHDESQRSSLLESVSSLPITASHLVTPEPENYFHARSVTHSRCVNALFKSAQSDVAVISDSDMAFVRQNWDEILFETVVQDNADFFGTPYADNAGFLFNLSHGQVFASKYQRKPNCAFIAYSPPKLKALTDRLCDMALYYGDRNSIPIQLVSNPLESKQYGLPVGAFRQLDAGSLIPSLIEQLKGHSHLLELRSGRYEVLKSIKTPANYPAILLPEEYFYDGLPFIVHLRKGSLKQAENDVYSWKEFMGDVRSWIGKGPSPQ